MAQKNKLKTFFLCITISVIWCANSIATDFLMHELWKGKIVNRKITDMKSIDVDKNGIKELVIISNYSSPLGNYKVKLGSYGKIIIYEWNGNALVKKWEQPEITTSISSTVVSSGDQEYLEIGTFSLNILNYKNGDYFLNPIKKSMALSWPNERILAIGSLVSRGHQDIIVTGYNEGKNYYIRLRDAKNPNYVLWTSLVLRKSSGIAIFGDFNRDGEKELLFEGGFWVYPEGKGFRSVEITSHKKSKYNTVLPLFGALSSDSDSVYFKTGETTKKDFDEVFYLEPAAYPYDVGSNLVKAIWKDGRFESENILSDKSSKNKELIGYKNLYLLDINNDGLDEIILSEVRGDLKSGEEEPEIINRRDVIQIIKWDGRKYKKIWSSQPLGEITQILIDDVTGEGRKEIIVGNAKGEIHIFGQK